MKHIYIIFLVFSTITYGQESIQIDRTKIKIFLIQDYGESKQFAIETMAKLEMVINSQAFKDSLLNKKMTQRKKLLNSELYQIIMAAHETKGPGKTKGQNHIIDIGIRTLNLDDDEPVWVNKHCKIGSKSGTIGLEGSLDGVTKICPQHLKKFQDNDNYAELAAHYMHEYMHILGFRHKIISKRKSVVYRLGDFVEAILKENVDLIQVTK